MSVLDDYVNPNAQRVLIEQVRGALQWNLHNIAFHHEADDATKRDMVERLINTATSKIGKENVEDIVANWTKMVEKAVG